MKAIDIFISSPGDVLEERKNARVVIDRLQRVYASRLSLRAIMWEDLPLGAGASFQEGIDLLLSEKYDVEIAVFIIWSRLGTALGPPHTRDDGTPYRSGTEREFELMLEARERLGGKRPHILVYARKDVEGFNKLLDSNQPTDKLLELLRQRDLVREFITEIFHDAEGRNIHAFHSYAEPISFAGRLNVHLKNLIDGMYGDPAAGEETWDRSPYRGLLAFDLEHASTYFGRENEVCDVELLLRRRAKAGNASVIIVGPSGSGKSSLARAGVADTLINGKLDPGVKAWRFGAMTPAAASGNLFGALAGALADSTAVPELASEGPAALEAFQKGLAIDPVTALTLKFDSAVGAAARAAGGDVMLLFLLDQMEELWLATEISAEARESFLRALGAMAAHPKIWLLATLRSDVYPRAMESEGFVRLKRADGGGDDRDGIFELVAPGPAALHHLIKKPAAMAGLRFEKQLETGRSLDETLLRDAADHPDALPLLEYTLDQLFERRDPAGLLTFDAYAALGGVEGALGKRVAETYDALPPIAQAALPEILPFLVSIDVADGLKSGLRLAALSDLTATEGRRLFTEKLREARFLTTGQIEGIAVAKLAHEALLRKWDRLCSWLSENRELLQLHEHVRRAYADYASESARGESPAVDLLLPAGLPLSRGQRALEGGVLNETEARFVRSSMAKEAAAQRKKRLLLKFIAFAAVAVAVIFGWLMLNAKRRTAEVNKLLAESDSERADRLFAEGDAASAVWYLCRATTDGSPVEQVTERLWFALNQRSWPIPVTAPAKLPAEVTALTFNPSGERFAAATRDGAVSIFSSADGSPIGAPMIHPKPVRAIQFNADGTMLLTACDDALARLWDVQRPAASLIGLSRHDNLIPAIAWSPDGKRYATGSWDKRLRVWDTARPEMPVFSVEMKDMIHTVAFDPVHPRRLLAVAKDEVCVWEIGSDTPVLRYSALEDLAGACFAPDGAKILSFGEKGDVNISEISGLQQWAQPPPLGDSCEAAAFSPSGKLFAAVSGKHMAVYMCARPPITLWDREFPAAVSRIKFSTEGSRLLAACDDANVYILDTVSGHDVSEPIFDAGIPIAIDFHPAGNRVLIARSTHTARVWRLSPPAPLPVCAFNVASPPLLLSQSRDVQCLAQKGAGMTFALPSRGSSAAPPLEFDFGTPLTAAAFDAAGRAVAGAMDGRILVMDSGHPKQIAKLDASISRLAFSSDGSFLAASDADGALAFLHWPGAAAIPLPPIHTQEVSGLALLDPGPKLVSASWDRHLALSDPLSSATPPETWAIDGDPLVTVTDPAHRSALVVLGTGAAWLISKTPAKAELAFHVSDPNCAAFSADGSVAAIGSTTGAVTVWDMQTRRKISEFHCGDSVVDALSFSANGRWLAVGMEDHEARIYQSGSGLPISGLMPHPGPVRQVVFAKNDSALLTATFDGIVLVWPLAVPDVARVEEISRRVMQDRAGGTRFVAAPDLVSAPDNASLEQLILTLRRQNAPAIQSQIDLLSAYLDPTKSAGSP